MGKFFSKSSSTKKEDEGRFQSDSSKDWESADDMSETSTSTDVTDKFSKQIVFDDFADMEKINELTESSDSADMNDLVYMNDSADTSDSPMNYLVNMKYSANMSDSADMSDSPMNYLVNMNDSTDMSDSGDINDLANTLDFSDIGDFTALSEQFLEFTKLLKDGTDEEQNSDSDLSADMDFHSLLLEHLAQEENYQNNEPENPPSCSGEGPSQSLSSTLPVFLHRVASLFNAGQRREQEDSKHPLRADSPMPHFSKLSLSHEEDEGMKYQGPIPVRLPVQSPLDIMWKNDLYVPHPSFEDMTLLLYPMRLIESNPPSPRPRTIIERSKSCFF